jgi:hypothetical protein
VVIAVSLLLILVAVALLVAGVVGSTNALIVGSIVVTVFAAIVLVAGVREAVPLEPDTDPDLAGGSPRLAPPPGAPTGPDRPGGPSRRPAGHTYAERATPAHDGATLVADPAGRADIPTQAGDPGRRGYRSADADTDLYGTGGPYEREAFEEPIEGELVDVEPVDVEPVDGEPIDAEPYDEATDGGSAGDLDDEDPPDEPAPQVVPASVAAAVAGLDTEVMVVDGRPRYHLDTCDHLRGRESEAIAVSEAVELGFTPCGLCRPDTALVEDATRHG